MRSRLEKSPEIDQITKFPVILDDCKAGRLLVQHIHKLFLHQGTESVVVELRKKFWIFKIKTIVKKVKNNCFWCKRKYSKLEVPEMGALPLCRVTRPPYPFFYTGMDFFGPIEVTVRRRHEKCWCLLFTCMSIRAIHIEVVHSLSTDSCIMAIQRFTSRKPCPREIFSDCGTNFIGTNRELQQQVKDLNHQKIQQTLIHTAEGIKWIFNPAHTLHMGGCWERLIRSVKKGLKAVLT